MNFESAIDFLQKAIYDLLYILEIIILRKEVLYLKSPKEILREILKTEGVKAVIIAGRDGLVISSEGIIDADMETIGAIASSGLGSSEALGSEARVGELEQLISQYKGGIAIIQLITEEALLLLLATKDANLGMLRLAINRSKKQLVEILSY